MALANVCFPPIADIRSSSKLVGMSALRIARYALLASAIVYVAALVASATGLIEPFPGLVVGSYAVIALGLAAIACLVVQVALFVRRRR